MNRYVAAGITLDALAGKRIIVLTATMLASRVALEDVATLAPVGATVRRANGMEGVTYPGGGSVTIRSYRQGARGHSADVIYLDEGVDAELRDPAAWDSLRASVATSPHGEIIRP